MKSLFVGSLLFISLIAVSGLEAQVPTQTMLTDGGSSSDDSEAIPVVEVPENSYYLGKISRNQEYEHCFKVMNLGTGNLEITEVVVG